MTSPPADVLDFDDIIIGSGLGGLVCADTLASKGRRVALFEQHSSPGGYCSSFEREGYVFDTVVDSIGGLDDRGVLGSIFRKLDLTGRLGAIRLDPIRENLFGTRSILVPATLTAYSDELARHFPTERRAISSFLTRLQQLFSEIRSSSMKDVYEGTVSPALEACRTLTWREFALPCVSDTVQDVIAERICYLGLPPSRCSAISMISMLMVYFDGGAFRIRGGCQNLANLLAEDARSRGALIRLSAPVRRILVANGTAVGVILDDGQTLRTRNVISNIDVRTTLKRLVGPGHLPTPLEAALSQPKPSLSFIVVHLGLSKPPQRLFGSTSIGYYPGGVVEHAFNQPDSTRQNSLIGFSIPTLDDPSLAPAGRHILAIHHPVTLDPATDWTHSRERIADQLIRNLESLMPGLSDSIVHRSIATPQTFERYTWNEGGVAYGWEPTVERWSQVQAIQSMLPNRLFLAGHWSDYGGGTVSAAISGHEVARNILRGAERQVEVPQHVG